MVIPAARDRFQKIGGARLSLVAVLSIGMLTGFCGRAQANLTWGSVSMKDSGLLPWNATDVDCPSARECIAVDQGGGAIVFDPASPGTPKRVVVDPSGSVPAAGGNLSCPSTTQCTMVDYGGGEVTFDPTRPGETTNRVQIASHAGLQAVSCASLSLCAAVGRDGEEVTFDPASPGGAVETTIDEYILSNALYGVDCPSSSQCTAVDASGGEVTFNPSSPGSPTRVGLGAQWLFGVSCPTTSQCTAVDNHGKEVTFNPSSPGSPTATTIDQGHGSGGDVLWSVSCPSTSQCTAGDGSGGAVTFDPASPAGAVRLDTGIGSTIIGVSCPSTGQCTAVDLGAGRASTFGSAVPTPITATIDAPQAVYGVSCPSSSLCAAVTKGARWSLDPHSQSTAAQTVTRTAMSAPGPLDSISCPSASQCTAVDYGGDALTFDPGSPGAPSPADVDRPYAVEAVSCPSVSQCTAVDYAGGEVTFDPASPGDPVRVVIDGAGGLDAISCPSTSQCTAVDHDGGQVTFDPASPGSASRVVIDGPNVLHGVSCPSTTQCTAVDGAGGEVTFDPLGAASPRVAIDSPHSLNAVSCATESFCVAVDTRGHAIEGDPRSHSWSDEELTIYEDPMASVDCASASSCLVGSAFIYGYVGSSVAPEGHGDTPVSTLQWESPLPPEVRITAHPPKETTAATATFKFAGVAGGTYECSIDSGGWAPCGSGDSFGPLEPGDHRFSVRETLQGLTGPAASYSWTVDLPRACILKVARARVFAFAHQSKARLVIRYKAYRPARATVFYSLKGSAGNMSLGTASSPFKTAGVFRLTERLDRAGVAKLRAASSIRVRFSIPAAPTSCSRYYTKRLTIPKRISGQTVWFQSDSEFSP